MKQISTIFIKSAAIILGLEGLALLYVGVPFLINMLKRVQEANQPGGGAVMIFVIGFAMMGLFFVALGIGELVVAYGMFRLKGGAILASSLISILAFVLMQAPLNAPDWFKIGLIGYGLVLLAGVVYLFESYRHKQNNTPPT